ncbi:MAG: uroporphyrinogen decarboxylase [Rhodospirillales bacterium]|nr:uroporphyrinogen decarboxylase [Rhodospirillales bacterium]
MKNPNIIDQVKAKRLIQALRGQACARPPFWFMRQAGRYLPEYQQLRRQETDFLKFCYTPELAIEATMQPLRRFSPDAAILFSDILVIADALGSGVRFVEGQGPVLEPLRCEEDIARLTPERVEEHLAPVFETVRGITRALPADVALIGFAGAPWTVALYMIEGRGGTDGSRARQWAYRNPASFAKLIASLVDATIVYLDRQIDCGAEAIQLFDSWAGLLAAEEFMTWVAAPTAQIVEALSVRHPQVPIIGFPRGCGVLYADYAEMSGVDCVGCDSGVPVHWIHTQLQTRCAVQGNLDNQLLRVGGENLCAATDRILAALGEGPFVFNLGHGILPDTPPQHLELVVERILGYQGVTAGA